MPTFPSGRGQKDFQRYDSQAEPTTQQPGAFISKDTSGERTAAIGKVGDAVQENTLKWSAAHDTIQKTVASANFKSGMLDVLTRATNDPNYNNSDQYYKEIEKLKTDSLKGFTSKYAEAQMMADLGYESKVGQIQIQNLYKKKEIDVGQTNALKLLDIEAQSPGADFEEKIGRILGEQVKAGIFDHKDAYLIQQQYIKKSKLNSFLIDLQNNPAIAENKLTKNEYGFEAKELSSAQKILTVESKKIQATVQGEILSAYLSGEDISQESIKNLMKEKRIDLKFAESMINKLKNPKPERPSKDLAFIEFNNRLLDLNAKGDKASLEELVEFTADAMQAHSEGLLDSSDMKRIARDRNEEIQKKLEGRAEVIMEQKRPKTWFERITFLSDEYEQDKPEIKARMYRKLLDGISQGGEPEKVLAKVINDELEIQLENNLVRSDRQYATNQETKQRIYSDDGGATWKDEKTGEDIK